MERNNFSCQEKVYILKNPGKKNSIEKIVTIARKITIKLSKKFLIIIREKPPIKFDRFNLFYLGAKVEQLNIFKDLSVKSFKKIEKENFHAQKFTISFLKD